MRALSPRRGQVVVAAVTVIANYDEVSSQGLAKVSLPSVAYPHVAAGGFILWRFPRLPIALRIAYKQTWTVCNP
jgi:hypothetical protein